MNKFQITIIIMCTLLSVLSKSFFFLIMGTIFIILNTLFVKIDIVAKKKKDKQKLQSDFHHYLKRVILLLYTRPIKQAFIDANNGSNENLNKKINQFNETLKFDYTLKPYTELALQINSDTEYVNYEINIMQLLFEMNKIGLGEEYINDLMNEIDLLIENRRKLEIKVLNDQSYTYTLPPTVINFIYVSFVLFKVIDIMIMSVIS